MREEDGEYKSFAFGIVIASSMRTSKRMRTQVYLCKCTKVDECSPRGVVQKMANWKILEIEVCVYSREMTITRRCQKKEVRKIDAMEMNR